MPWVLVNHLNGALSRSSPHPLPPLLRVADVPPAAVRAAVVGHACGPLHPPPCCKASSLAAGVLQLPGLRAPCAAAGHLAPPGWGSMWTPGLPKAWQDLHRHQSHVTLEQCSTRSLPPQISHFALVLTPAPRAKNYNAGIHRIPWFHATSTTCPFWVATCNLRLRSNSARSGCSLPFRYRSHAW